MLDYTEKQVEALDLIRGPQRNTMLAGGARSGKTTIFCAAILSRAARAAGTRHGIFRFRFNAVWASIGLDTLPKTARLLGVPIRLRASDHFFELPNESQIWLGGLDEKKRLEKILGQEFSTLYENEASEIPYNSHVTLTTRLAETSILPQRHFVDLNPSGTAHWAPRLFVQGVDPETRKPLHNPRDYNWMRINPVDNRANLSPAYLRSLETLPQRARKRFYEGEFSDDIDGALWPYEIIDRCHVTAEGQTDGWGLEDYVAYYRPRMRQIVVSVDPSGTRGPEDKRADSVGIVVAGEGMDGHGYVLEDLTTNLGPAGWARVACDAYDRWLADRIIAERNFGGAMVEHTIRTHDPLVPFKEVVASRGKAVRAEPISTLYAKDMVHHVKRFSDLEEQMINTSSAGYLGEKSPDRMDAMVWAISDMMVGDSTYDSSMSWVS